MEVVRVDRSMVELGSDSVEMDKSCRYRERRASEHEKIAEHERKLDFDNIPVPADLDELIAMLRQIFSNELVNVEYVRQLIANYKSNPKDWRQYAKYDPHK